MSELVRVLGLAVLCGGLAVLFKNTQPVFAWAVVLCGGALALYFCVRALQTPLAAVLALANESGFSAENLQILCKAVGIGCLCELVAAVSADCGQTALAAKVNLAGKIAILALSVPLVYQLFSCAKGLLS